MVPELNDDWRIGVENLLLPFSPLDAIQRQRLHLKEEYETLNLREYQYFLMKYTQKMKICGLTNIY